MRRTTMVIVLVATMLGLGVSPVLAHDKGSIQHKNRYLRTKVIQKHGKRAPGRDIVRFGIRPGKRARHAQIHRYFEQLRKLAFPGRYLVVRAVPPAQRPAGTQSARMSATGLAACIVQRESGGNPQASNGTHTGIGQWTGEAWARHGGLRYASSPLGASYQQQLQVLNDGLSRYGCRDWCPFDGC
jgi:hypothetical protein